MWSCRSGESLDALNSVWRTQHILNHVPLSAVEVLVLIGSGDCLRSRENRLDLAPALPYTANDFVLSRDGFGCCELTTRHLRPFHRLEFSGCNSSIQIAPDLCIGNIAHTSTESVPDQNPLVYDGLAFEILIARKSERFSNPLKRVDRRILMLRPSSRRAYYRIGLVSKVSCELPMRCHHFSR